ncbi:MAG: hypothetical protein L6V93_04625 [Clostridiales bacterium]|nr:MAG: hypothetical protein L6V93_04625 [Clostridiales bacterium]
MTLKTKNHRKSRRGGRKTYNYYFVVSENGSYNITASDIYGNENFCAGKRVGYRQNRPSPAY